MYKMIVAREVRGVWKALDAGDYEPVLKGFAREFRYENIAADHALGGTFTTREQMAQHFALMFRVFPDLHFTVRNILVSGWPGATSVIVDVGIAGTLADGTPYENELVQQMTLRWGKVTEVRALLDNVRARAALDRLAETGVLDPAPVAAG